MGDRQRKKKSRGTLNNPETTTYKAEVEKKLSTGSRDGETEAEGRKNEGKNKKTSDSSGGGSDRTGAKRSPQAL